MSCSKSRTALPSSGERGAQPGQAAMPIVPRVRPAPKEAIQKRALAEGLPYQTLISSLLHKYASGRLKEV